MSRALFEASTKKAFMISGGTEKERFDKMSELFSEFKGLRSSIHGSGAQMAYLLVKRGAPLENLTIENPVLLIIEPASRESEYSSVHGYEMDFIRRLAIQQGSVIDLTPTPSVSLQCGV